MWILVQLLSLLWQKFLTKPFLQKLYFLFLEILNSKQMVQVSSLSFYLTILRKKKCNFWKNSFIENFRQMMITTGLLFDDRLRQHNEWKYTLLVKMLHHCFETYPVLSFQPKLAPTFRHLTLFVLQLLISALLLLHWSFLVPGLSLPIFT